MKPQAPGPVALVLAALAGIFLILPLVALVPVSFTPTRFLQLPDGEWSARHYRTLIEEPRWLAAAWLSVRIGLLSAVIATTLATLFAVGLWMLRPRFAGLAIGIALLPLVAPPVVSALTLYFLLATLGQVSGLVAYDTLLGVVIAHTVMVAPFAVVIITIALSQVDRRIDLAARSMGAGYRDRMVRVILPNIRFALLAAGFLTFILSWEEIGVTLFITSVNVETLPRLMWSGLRDNIDPAVAAVSVILSVLVGTIVIARAVLGRRRRYVDGP